MTARVIDGKAVAAEVRREIAADVARLRALGVVPGLATVLVGRDPASDSYVRSKTRAAADLGLATFDHRHPDGLSQEALAALVARLNADPAVHGILVQLPLPAGLDARPILDAIDPRKDVDGLHPVSVGRLWSGRPGFVPCTPAGILRLLAAAGTRLAGAEAVVVGRSNLVGKPVAALLLAAHATVTLCHSRTADLAAVVGRADLVVAAAGQPGLVRGAWIKPGATVIDVGTNRVDGRLVGDVEFAAAAERAAAISPVPGGVGPMTITMLMANTVQAATAIALP